ncbi:conserved hypothetical protein [Frankia canadensis]|uniref:Uncharacterized protein n=1 Tax=Frankia canadensis TaxID=1836972 RepID=A0A2I2KN96_9ACTN|nr:hypothetical protein [Frankia canadensis]SNQ47119.1 conserved hypothetical protein [Frankia canadensis]SOU54409.1 conserved hypothetical protein [Frankia canadensis]
MTADDAPGRAQPQTPPRCSARVLRLPKNPIDPIEDGAALSERTGRFAVADGASAGRDVHLWAQALVRAYIREPPPGQASDADLRDWFLAVATQHAATLPAAVGPSWLDEGPGAVTSAYATFLGLQLVFDEHGDAQGGASWQAIAVGDCCLLKVASAGEVTSFPLTDPDQFSDTPSLLPGQPDLLAAAMDATTVQRSSGPLAAGDTLLLATDAVARWLLTLAREPDGLRQVIRTPRDDLRTHLAAQRTVGAVDKDDLTLLTIRLHPAPAPPQPPCSLARTFPSRS